MKYSFYRRGSRPYMQKILLQCNNILYLFQGGAAGEGLGRAEPPPPLFVSPKYFAGPFVKP